MFEIVILLVLLPIGLAATLFYSWGATHNRLAALDARCDTAFADIDVMLKRRHDLLPGLIEVTKGFTGHERDLISQVIEARKAAYTHAASVKTDATTGKSLTQVIQSVLATAEKYPDLKASPHFERLRQELTDAEDRLAGARRYFNLCVEEYNATLRQFPGSFVGAKMQLGKRRQYDLGIERVLLDEPVAVAF